MANRLLDRHFLAFRLPQQAFSGIPHEKHSALPPNLLELVDVFQAAPLVNHLSWFQVPFSRWDR
jgi:hypothetical protein